MKIAYIIHNETPDSGLLNTQVFNLLSELSVSNKLNITLYAIWQPVIFIRDFAKIRKLKNRLSKVGVNLVSIPFALPGRYFFKNEVLLEINTLFTTFVMSLFSMNRYDVVHCRGYFITSIMTKLKKKFKLIFDMRSMFPEENVSSGNWNEFSPIYNKWKIIEEINIRNSEATVAVSQPMATSLKENYSLESIYYIPIGFDFESESHCSDLNLKKLLGIEEKFIVGYCGSLELGFWNDISIYSEYFKGINSSISNAHFLLLTGSNHLTISNYLKNQGVDNFTLLSLKYSDVPKYLQICDCGIQVMSRHLDSSTRFGVKTVEYWAAGIPVLTNSNVGGACYFMKGKPFLGAVVNSSSSFDYSLLEKREMFNSDEIRKLAVNEFSFKNVSKLYNSLYQTI